MIYVETDPTKPKNLNSAHGFASIQLIVTNKPNIYTVVDHGNRTEEELIKTIKTRHVDNGGDVVNVYLGTEKES